MIKYLVYYYKEDCCPMERATLDEAEDSLKGADPTGSRGGYIAQIRVIQILRKRTIIITEWERVDE